ncbi:MAG: hypothetical protein AAFQ43_11105 [Bacteroidota bacterium]
MRTLTALLVLLLIAPASGAQSLLDRARNAVSGGGQSIEDRAAAMNTRSRAGSPPPAALLGAYLSSVRIQEQPVLGTFLTFQDARFVFLPTSEGTATLTRNGETVARYTWETYTARGPFYDMEPLQMTSPQSEYSMLGYPLEQPGDYAITYEAGGEAFWTMPFTVNMSGGDDPYNPDPSFRLDGLWNDHAYLLHDKDGEGAWDFKLWIHADDFTRSDRYNADEPTMLTITPVGESTPALLAESGKSFINNGNWNRVDFRLKKRHRYDSAAQRWELMSYTDYDRLLPDGEYRVELTIGGDLYGSYPMTVRDGLPVHTGAQASGADPMTRIDGGGAAYWLYRE